MRTPAVGRPSKPPDCGSRGGLFGASRCGVLGFGIAPCALPCARVWSASTDCLEARNTTSIEGSHPQDASSRARETVREWVLQRTGAPVPSRARPPMNWPIHRSQAGCRRQDSNLSEPGGRAMSQDRACRRPDAGGRTRTSASPEGERCRRIELAAGRMPEAGLEPQRARRASDVAGSSLPQAGCRRQDSNLSEPGGRAMSQDRACRRPDAGGRTRTSASPEGERCRRIELAAGRMPEAGLEPQRARRASDVAGSSLPQAGCRRQDSNLRHADYDCRQAGFWGVWRGALRRRR